MKKQNEVEKKTVAKEENVARLGTVTFKKQFQGFAVNEVLDYIEQQDETYKKSCDMYDEKIDTYKSDIALLNRENDSLKQQIEKQKEKVKEAEEKFAEVMSMSVAAFKKEKEKAGDTKVSDPTQALINDAIENTNIALQEANKKIEYLNDEIAEKDQKINEFGKKHEDVSVIESKLEEQIRNNDELSEKNIELSLIVDQKSSQIKILNEDMAKLDDIVEDAKKMYAQVDRLKTQTESYKQATKDMQIELFDIKEKYDVLSMSNESAKKTIEMQENKIADLTEQIENFEKVNAELVERLIDYKRKSSEEKNALETEFNESKHKLQQTAQMHLFQFKQVELAFGELKTHIEKAADTLNELNNKN